MCPSLIATTQALTCLVRNLADFKIDGSTLSFTTAVGASLSGASAIGVKALYADWRNLDARGIDLSNSLIFMSDLSGADLSNANLTGARFVLSNLSGAKLVGAHLEDTAIIYSGTLRADLSDTEITASSVFSSLTPRVRLEGAKFDRTDVLGTTLQQLATPEQTDGMCLRYDPSERINDRDHGGFGDVIDVRVRFFGGKLAEGERALSTFRLLGGGETHRNYSLGYSLSWYAGYLMPLSLPVCSERRGFINGYDEMYVEVPGDVFRDPRSEQRMAAFLKSVYGPALADRASPYAFEMIARCRTGADLDHRARQFCAKKEISSLEGFGGRCEMNGYETVHPQMAAACEASRRR